MPPDPLPIDLGAEYASYFEDRVEKIPESGCWIWCYYVNHNGYGHLMYQGNCYRAHRVSYQCFVGPIPDGMEIDHLCRVRSCVNPSHLEVVDRLENRRRGGAPGGALYTRPTHCRVGHALTGTNIIKKSERRVQCRICHRLVMRNYYARQVRKKKEGTNGIH